MNACLSLTIITHADVVAGVGRLYALYVCVYVSTLKEKHWTYHHQTCQITSLGSGNRFYLRSKGQMSRCQDRREFAVF